MNRIRVLSLILSLFVVTILFLPSAGTAKSQEVVLETQVLLEQSLTVGDSPVDAPMSSNAPEPLATGDTNITYHLPKVSFRVNDGYDLDQYLFLESSPIDFYIDMDGFETDSVHPARVTLRVYDVDTQGAEECGPEIDKVYVNGAYLGDLTGANNQWSIVTYTIPSNALNSGSNHFQISIDTTGSSCWAVQVDWAEIEIDFNIAQVEASAFDDIAIKRGTSDDIISDPVWQRSFNADGSLPSPSMDDPIADKIQGGWFGWGERQLEYRYKLESWPSSSMPDWEPQVSYAWEIVGTGQNSGGFHDLDGWENEFDVTLPDKVGKVTLHVTLRIYRENELLITEDRNHILYVIYDSPPFLTVASGFQLISTNQPRTAWLDVATDWAANMGSETQILEALNSGEYGSGNNPLGWNYGYYNSTPLKEDPITLIENGNGKNGDCFVFRDVWRVLAASLGISTGSTSYQPSGGFMTSTRSALDGNASANALNLSTGNRDRWFFNNHQYGSFGGNFYDPTFGLIGPNTTAGKESNVYCKVSGVSGGLLNCDVLNPPPATVQLGNAGESVNGWTVATYQTLTPFSTESNTSSVELSSVGSFTGNTNDSGLDQDGNGLFEFLEVKVEVDVSDPGTFVLQGFLVDGVGNVIALSTLEPDLFRMAPVNIIDLNSGIQEVTLYFEGYAIQTSEIDGPYNIQLFLSDDNRTVIEELNFASSTYSYQQFQGLTIDVASLSDAGLDEDGLPGFETLRLAAEVNMLTSGEVYIQGHLFAGATFLTDFGDTFNLNTGSQIINLDFDGQTIAASGFDGPYTVYLSYNDANFGGNMEYTTAAYSASDFQVPVLFFTGNASDMGIDDNGNGLFDSLDVSVEVASLVSDNPAVISALLLDNDGSLIDSTEVSATLDIIPEDVTLSFDGQTINRHGADGPYLVHVTLLDANDNEMFGFDYSTSAYSQAAFESPAVLFNDTYSDIGVDTNGDGYFDYLRVGVGVQVEESDTFLVDGSLHDAAGNFIASVQTELFLTAGSNIVNLDFDGLAIRAHGVDGPYRLLGLDIRVPSGLSEDGRQQAYETAAYAYTEFQPLSIEITNNFNDYGEDTNGNGLYDYLTVEAEVNIAQSDTYNFNARLVDGNGEEIVWAAYTQFLSAGTQTILLQFDGRYIYGNGVDGPYEVKNLSIYSNTEFSTLVDVYTTGAFNWQAFEPSGVIIGSVFADGDPVAAANVFISGIDSDLSDDVGLYRLTVLNDGTYIVTIDADPELLPWQIWVNGVFVAEGSSVEVDANVGEVTEVNFISTSVIAVDIDVKPGVLPNKINAVSRGVVLVAILSQQGFDATTEVNRSSLTFGRTGDEDSLRKWGRNEIPWCYEKDINNDNIDDLVCRFSILKTEFTLGDTVGILKGETIDGTALEGSDSVVIISRSR